MSRSPAILRRYTPPTCTLEVSRANDSPLSRWASQPVVKDVRFQLSLDDPKLPDDQWITVEGDRSQLESLREAVSNYVHHLLLGSAQELDFSSVSEADDPAIATHPLVDSQTHSAAALPNSAGISLQPQGLLNHKLHLGSLTPVDMPVDTSGDANATVQLSTLQLFDLANALDEYSADILDLPALPRAGWVKPFPQWASIAAVMLVAVGLTTSVVKLMDGSGSNAPTLPTSSQGASSSDQKIATQLPPAVVDKATPPVLSTQKLPPPPPAGSTLVKPGTPAIILPKLAPAPKPSPGLPPGAISTYPVPVPERPTVIGGGVQLESRSKDSSQIAIAPQPAAAVPNAMERTQLPTQRGLTRNSSGDATNAAGSTAFDTIPQVAEARSYFQRRWKPPEGLTQTLEYTLQINADGTIQSIVPLKQASGDYLDRTGIPLIGEPFVSPLKTKPTAKIRLVLEPNGEVRTFLEGN